MRFSIDRSCSFSGFEGHTAQVTIGTSGKRSSVCRKKAAKLVVGTNHSVNAVITPNGRLAMVGSSTALR